MKACIVQNKYSMNPNDIDEYFLSFMDLLNSINEKCDIVVLSEDSDVPSAIKDKDTYTYYVHKNHDSLFETCKNLAKRCSATVFVNSADATENGNINTTFVISKEGDIIGKYQKAHPAPSEYKPKELGGLGFDSSYANSYSKPYTITIDNVKYAFLTCYDFYFLDNYTNIARQRPDVIIGCSLQRTDAHSTLETMCKSVAYNISAYLVRASVSLGLDSQVCGCSCVVSPDGTIIENMKNEVGYRIVEFDPKKKFLKASGFGGKLGTHFDYTEQGRRPWLYAKSGCDMVAYDDFMPYPRLCAHRGFSVIAPENTIVSLASAVSLDADEIEFDLWQTKDGYIVSNHDPTLQRTSNGVGRIDEHTLKELEELDFGSHFNPGLAGLKVLRFEDILRKLGGKTVMNVHLKTKDDISDVDPSFLDTVVKIIDDYDCRRYVYLMITNDKLLEYALTAYPDITRCVGANYFPNPDIDNLVDRAIKYKAKKIQIFIPYYDKLGIKLNDVKDKIDRAHENGIIVNLFYADTIYDAQNALDLGVDCVLTNNYLEVYNAVKQRLGRKI